MNGVSVFVMSINNNLKCAEKFELFKSLSNSYLALAHAIESYDEGALTREKINELTEKYDVLVGSTPFEDKIQKPFLYFFHLAFYYLL